MTKFIHLYKLSDIDYRRLKWQNPSRTHFAPEPGIAIHIDRLKDSESKKAIIEPIRKDACPVVFSEVSVNNIVRESGGYPYFIQFLCREVYDIFIQLIQTQKKVSSKHNRTLEFDAAIAWRFATFAFHSKAVHLFFDLKLENS